MAQKKINVKTLTEKRAMIEKQNKMTISWQCELLGIHRSGLYYKPLRENEENLRLMRLLDEQYLKTPFYGEPKLTAWLRGQGYLVNHKRVERLMKVMGWQTIFRKPNLSKPSKEHKVHPYLLKGLNTDHCNQVWAVDITYVPMRRGYLYLYAIIDLHTRYILNWSISNTMTATWCCQILKEAIELYGKPEIINSDQGSQFTSDEWVEACEGIQISMDGKGRALDNIFIERIWKTVKYECIYLHVFEDGVQLYEGLKEYFRFYNYERTHQSLAYKTPASQYLQAA
jgi:putative transposase